MKTLKQLSTILIAIEHKLNTMKHILLILSIATYNLQLSATTITVTNTNNSGAGSLRQAVIDAVNGDIINFSLTYPTTIILTSGEISFNKSLTITGPGASDLAVDGNSTSRIFNVTGGTSTISGLTIQNGTDPSFGGGINNQGGGILTIANCTVSGNASSAFGGGVSNFNGSTLTLTNCIVSGNTSSAFGGGISNLSGSTLTLTSCIVSGNTSSVHNGGIFNYNSSTLYMTNCTVSGNAAPYIGGGILNYYYSTATITNCTVSGNTAGLFGGGIANYYFPTLSMTNCTVSGNTSSSFGGGIANVSDATLTLMNCTVSGNTSATNGDGIYHSDATLEITNTIFSNATENYAESGTVTTTSNGYNISSDGTMTFLTNTGDMQNTDPLLNALADNGGPTQTHSLQSGSPAINAGTSVGAPPTDQRGVARVGATDIGAFEAAVTCTSPTIACPADVTVSNDAGECGAGVTWDDATVTGTPAPTVTYSPANGSFFGVGTATVTATAENACDTVTCTFTVTVEDTEDPSISCPSGQSRNTDWGTCAYEATGNEFDPTYDDNCPDPSVSNDYNNGSSLAGASFPVGTTTVTWEVTDASGNTASCTFDVTVEDNEDPVAKCKDVTVTLSGGSASISASDVDDGSSDNCGIASMTVSPSSFNCSNIGSNTVTLTVEDAAGNSSTCTATVTVVGTIPTCSITPIPSDNTYTGGVPTTIYLGYGPQSVTLSASASGGGPFTYSWSGTGTLSCYDCAAPVFAPTTYGNYTFTVVITNSYGCTVSCSITICVIDVQVPGQANKVYLCHVPPGNPNNPNTLSISVSAVPSHLGNHAGDHLGTCTQSCANPGGSKVGGDVPGEFAWSAYPNPSDGHFELLITSTTQETTTLVIYDALGKITASQEVDLVAGTNEIEMALPAEVASGVYNVTGVINGEMRILKLTKQN